MRTHIHAFEPAYSTTAAGTQMRRPKPESKVRVTFPPVHNLFSPSAVPFSLVWGIALDS
jgi:hypothetical protein